MKNPCIRCPVCGSRRTVKRGKRETRHGSRQLYQCGKCRKRFSLSAMKGFTYSPEAVIAAPVYYYLGYPLSVIQSRITTRFKQAPSLSTVANWIQSFGKYSSIKKYRQEITDFCPPGKLIGRKLLKHRQNYLLQVHWFKLARAKETVPGLHSYIQNIMSGDSAINPDDFTMRGSTLGLGSPLANPHPYRNYVCKIASIALQSAKSNSHRHSSLQRFFLAIDNSTIAVEVPVFLSSAETVKILGIPGGLLGHIDFLLIFKDKITILDYKPGAHLEHHVSEQLFLYAVALSRRTGIHLRDIRCAWFDEVNYYSFSSISAYARFRQLTAGFPGFRRNQGAE